MFLLDTDTFSQHLRGNPLVTARVAQHKSECLLSAVAAREALQGALARITAAEAPNAKRPDIEGAYSLFLTVLEGVGAFAIHPHTNAAEALYRSWDKSVQRIGPSDCRIAAAALLTGATVVTCNTKHFEQIAAKAGRFDIVDWSR